MSMSGYTFTERLLNGIKRFFLKTFILLVVIIGFTVYFLKSDFGNSVQLLKDFKEHTNQKIAQTYESQTTELSNSVRKDLGLQPVVLKNDPATTVPTQNTPTVAQPNALVPEKTIVKEAPAIVNEKPLIPPAIKDEKSVVNPNPVVEVSNTSGLPLYKIPFYYDHSNAPKGVSKEEALNILKRASQQWTDSCGITFDYKGDKLADYVNNKNVIGGSTGIIKWETQMEGSAIGEAHVGTSRGPAPGFVLALFSDFFARNKADLVNTITHEMGHVIGLDHSANKNSVMFPTERPSAQLQESDKAMCRYFRYRWPGMSKNQAQDKSGVISNGGYD